MDPKALERYSRQLRLPQMGEEGQRRLNDARALIVGLGGLGSPASLYLAAAGVGRLVLSDYDRVEVSNLQRQVIHRQADLGRAKAESAREALLGLNPALEVRALDWQLADDELGAEVEAADVVLDCSDNFPTRFALNAACVRTGTPLVSGAAIRLEGQLMTIIPRRADSPCYRCLYTSEEERAESCAMEGVLAPVVGVIGCLQALEAVKLIAQVGEPLCGRLLLFDARGLEWQEVRVSRNPNCPACSNRG